MAATRASPLLILLLTIIQLNLLLHLPDSSPITALAQPADEQQQNAKQHRQPALVQSTCNSTSFYDVCIAALAADPSSSTADVPGLCAIAVSAAAANASGTAAFLGNASVAAATPEADRALVRTCAGKYAAARDALLKARASLAEQDYDYAFVHVSAANEYPAVCRTLFRRRQQQQKQRGASSTPYPPELAKREEALRRLCTIALDIISLLQNQEPQ
jgi:pectinesterase inhibitor-like protein|uniref:Invertase inhibitor 2 n=1 Tax=Saccharum hybrid cultivar GT28 TaxID=1214490 RepID=A0A219L1H0_9POAL|nr:invertase inhibitor 2 [Saccharum hybrid cultivar GT28]